MPEAPFPVIDPNSTYVTLVNVYEVDPLRQAELVQAISDLTDSTTRHQPGFVSVSLHSSLDGTKVVNYGQWRTKEHFDDFMGKPETKERLSKFVRLVKSMVSGLYRANVVHTN